MLVWAPEHSANDGESLKQTEAISFAKAFDEMEVKIFEINRRGQNLAFHHESLWPQQYQAPYKFA